MPSFGQKIKSAWNAFANEKEDREDRYSSGTIYTDFGASYGSRPDRVRLNLIGDKTIIGSVYNRLAIDFATVEWRHVKLDGNERFREEIKSTLNECISLDPNVDQTARAFWQDVAMTLFDKGVAAIVPIDTSDDPDETGSYDIESMRVGYVVTWLPQHVMVSVYDERTGLREEVKVSKRDAAIIENPLYSVMNEPNSTLQRLIKKLSMLDLVDEQTSSGKLDLIIQLPYTIKTEARQAQAEKRRKDIEFQLKGSQYGIAYTDGTEKITQLNRPAENNLLAQVKELTDQLYSQLGLTPDVFNGTASQETMLNYYHRAIDPLLTAVKESMTRSFLTKTARTQGQSIVYHRDPFKLVPVSELADIADKFTRNEIITANELRSFIGMKPSEDSRADELRNSNMPESKRGVVEPGGEVIEGEVVEPETDSIMDASFDELESSMDEIFADLGIEPEEDDDEMVHSAFDTLEDSINEALIELGIDPDEDDEEDPDGTAV